jgi:hypothetical protein
MYRLQCNQVIWHKAKSYESELEAMFHILLYVKEHQGSLLEKDSFCNLLSLCRRSLSSIGFVSNCLIDEDTNLADLLSKHLPDQQLRDSLDSYLTDLSSFPCMG